MSDAFDFWLGDWRVTDPADGGVGRNTIRRVLSGKVIEERFSFPGPDGKAYRGRSHTVHVDGRGWCQTWVDSTGLYLDFVGGLTDAGMVLERRAVLAGAAVVQRMAWSDVTAHSLTWRWLRAAPGSQDWQQLWRLDYVRVG